MDHRLKTLNNESHPAHHVILPHEQDHNVCLRTLIEMRAGKTLPKSAACPGRMS